MSDKDFKVKNKLVVNGLTGGAGPLIANSNKEIDSVAFLTTLQGGTGTTTSPSAGQVLYSAGGTSYNPTALNTLDVKGASYSADAPSNPVVGQVWIESDSSSDSFDPNIIRRKSFTATAGQTTFTTDLEFIQGYEQVFFNGMLLVRNNDYTTTNNTTVVLTTAAAVNDVVEVVTITNLNSINAATTTSNTFVGNQIIQGSVSITGIAESVHVDGAAHAYRIRANASNNSAAIQFTNNSASTDWAYINTLSANKMIIRKSNGANTAPYDSWLNINGGTVLIRDVLANNEEASDWPVPSLSVQSYDTYFENTMFGLFLRDDNPYTLDFSKWVMRLSHGMGDTTSSSSTNLKFGGPGSLILSPGNAERMRVRSDGNVSVGWAGDANWGLSINTATAGAGAFLSTSSANLIGALFENSNASFTNNLVKAQTFRSNNSGFIYYSAISNVSVSGDTDWYVRGDGQVFTDGSTSMSSPADYAEYFEWEDGNPDNEDRSGYSVSLVNGTQIKIAEDGEDVIGIISANPAVIGDAAWNMWTGKYEKDEFNRYVRDENGDRVLSSEFDPEAEYVSRENRPEWSPVGMVGKLRMRKGQLTDTRWIKMRDISAEVEEWLVR